MMKKDEMMLSLKDDSTRKQIFNETGRKPKFDAWPKPNNKVNAFLNPNEIIANQTITKVCFALSEYDAAKKEKENKKIYTGSLFYYKLKSRSDEESIPENQLFWPKGTFVKSYDKWGRESLFGIVEGVNLEDNGMKYTDNPRDVNQFSDQLMLSYDIRIYSKDQNAKIRYTKIEYEVPAANLVFDLDPPVPLKSDPSTMEPSDQKDEMRLDHYENNNNNDPGENSTNFGRISESPAPRESTTVPHTGPATFKFAQYKIIPNCFENEDVEEVLDGDFNLELQHKYGATFSLRNPNEASVEEEGCPCRDHRHVCVFSNQDPHQAFQDVLEQLAEHASADHNQQKLFWESDAWSRDDYNEECKPIDKAPMRDTMTTSTETGPCNVVAGSSKRTRHHQDTSEKSIVKEEDELVTKLEIQSKEQLPPRPIKVSIPSFVGNPDEIEDKLESKKLMLLNHTKSNDILIFNLGCKIAVQLDVQNNFQVPKERREYILQRSILRWGLTGAKEPLITKFLLHRWAVELNCLGDNDNVDDSAYVIKHPIDILCPKKEQREIFGCSILVNKERLVLCPTEPSIAPYKAKFHVRRKEPCFVFVESEEVGEAAGLVRFLIDKLNHKLDLKVVDKSQGELQINQHDTTHNNNDIGDDAIPTHNDPGIQVKHPRSEK